jgi:hypothetical protein
MNVNEIKEFARYLKKGNTPKGKAGEYIAEVMKNYDGDSVEILAAFENTFNETQEQNLKARILEYIHSVTNCDVNVTVLDKEMGIVTQRDRDNRRQIMHRLCENDVLELIRQGVYKRKDLDLNEIDIENCDSSNTIEVKLPFGLHTWVNFYSRNLIVIAGDTDAGKSAMGINILKLNNESKMPLKYFNSEMGAEELKKRFTNAGIIKPNFKIYERDHAFYEVFNPNAINLVDYLELTENHYLIAEEFKRATAVLKKGIAIYLIQKKFGATMGYGAESSMWKARLYVTLSYDKSTKSGKLYVVKAKNPKIEGVNIKDWEWEYSLKRGTDFEIISEPNGIIEQSTMLDPDAHLRNLIQE